LDLPRARRALTRIAGFFADLRTTAEQLTAVERWYRILSHALIKYPEVVRPDVNVVPVTPPVREINSKGTAALNARRAGNCGKSKRRLKE